jgi:transposase
MGRNTVERAFHAFRAAGLLDGDPGALPETASLIEALKTAQPPKAAPQQISSVDPWRSDIEQLWRRDAGPTSIHDWLRLNADDYTGSLSAVKRMCASLRRDAPPDPDAVAIPLETEPGEEAQVDFVDAGKVYDPERGVLRKCYLFVMVLSYSRHFFADFVFDQKVATWIRLHISAFEFFGGVPRVIVPDNLKSAVIRAAFGLGGEATLNRSYIELAHHYGFQIDPTPPRSPEKKGKVERAGGYVKYNFIKTHTSVDIETSRRALKRWVMEIAAQRIHGVTGRRPMELFEAEERACLLPLPERAYEMVIWKSATLHRDAHVQVDGAFYSAPWKHIHEKLDVKLVGRQVSIYRQGMLLCTHAKVARGKRQTVDLHLPEHRGELRRRSRSYWTEKAALIGPDCLRLAETIFESDDVLLQLRKVQAVVSYLERHPRDRANAAARRALHYRSLSYMAVKNILLKGLDLEPLEEEERTRNWASGSRFARDPAQTLLAFKEREHEHADGTGAGTQALEALGRAGDAGPANEGGGG